MHMYVSMQNEWMHINCQLFYTHKNIIQQHVKWTLLENFLQRRIHLAFLKDYFKYSLLCVFLLIQTPQDFWL